MKHILWALPVLLTSATLVGCHRHSHLRGGVEYYAPLEPAVTAASDATRNEKEADAEVIAAREREADANQRLAEAEQSREAAEAIRVAAEERATKASKAKAAAEERARAAEIARAHAEQQAREPKTSAPSVVIVVDRQPESPRSPSKPLPPVAAPSQWGDDGG